MPLELPSRPFGYTGQVFFATPSYDANVSVHYLNSMLKAAVLLTAGGVRMEHYIHAGDYDLGNARCSIVEAFLQTEATDLIFVDADVGFDAKVLPRLLMYDQLVVGGLVPKRNRTRSDEYHMGALTGVIQNGLFQSLELPTAFMRIKREVFARMRKPWFKLNSNPMEKGEDIYFCRRLHEIGEYCWIDSDIDFTHQGTRVWEGNFYEHCIEKGILTKAGAEPAVETPDIPLDIIPIGIRTPEVAHA